MAPMIESAHWEIVDYAELCKPPPGAVDQVGAVEQVGALGRVIAAERSRWLLPQRVVARRSGVHQSNLSAYERGRLAPGWDVFVRILAAMDRRPVLRTEPLYLADRSTTSIGAQLDAIVGIIGDRGYRIEDAAAAHILGDGSAIETVYLTVEGDPAALDELAAAAAAPYTTVTTRRPHRGPAEIEFTVSSLLVVLVIVGELGPAVEVEYEGRRVRVAPLEDLTL